MSDSALRGGGTSGPGGSFGSGGASGGSFGGSPHPSTGMGGTTVRAEARKAKKVAYVAAVAIVIIFTAVAFTLRGRTESGRSEFHIEDQISMVLLGLLAAGLALVFTRPRIVANSDGVRVRNLLGWKYIPWEMIAAVRFDRGSPWVALDLQDDNVISVMAVQAADKEYAVGTVRRLRAMLAGYQETRRSNEASSAGDAQGSDSD